MTTELGKMVKSRMETLGLTYQKTADLAGISKDYVYKIIQGDRNPEFPTLVKLADALQMDKQELLSIAYRDRAPGEVESLFSKRPDPKHVYEMLLMSLTTHANYIQENPYSKKLIDLVSKIDPSIKEAINQEKDFRAKFRRAQIQLESFLTRESRNSNEKKTKEKLVEELDQLSEKAEASRNEMFFKKKKVLALDFPLLTDEYPENPFLQKEKKEWGEKRWQLILDETGDTFHFAYKVKDNSMAPLIELGDMVIVHAGEDPAERKPVIAKVKGKGIVIRKYRPYEKKIFLTPVNTDFEDFFVNASEIEWLHPIKGVYREIKEKPSYF